MQKIKKTYQYDGEKYLIRVPDGAKSILEESRYLDHCIQRGTRYFERIATRESYILFLRKKDDPNTPWYTLEVEPGEQSDKSAATTTTSSMIWKMPNRSLQNGSWSSSGA